jgi:hypothetical protein
MTNYPRCSCGRGVIKLSGMCWHCKLDRERQREARDREMIDDRVAAARASTLAKRAVQTQTCTRCKATIPALLDRCNACGAPLSARSRAVDSTLAEAQRVLTKVIPEHERQAAQLRNDIERLGIDIRNVRAEIAAVRNAWPVHSGPIYIREHNGTKLEKLP